MPAHLDGEERNWLIVRAAKDRRGRARAGLRADARARGQARPERDGLGVRDRLGAACARWRRSRARAARFQHDGGDALDARCEARARAHAARAAHERVRAGRRHLRVRRRGSAEPGAAGERRGDVVYVVFDVLEFETEPLLDEPWTARRERLEALLDDRVARGAALTRLRRRRRAAQRRAGTRPRHRGQAPHVALPPGRRSATTGACCDSRGRQPGRAASAASWT